MKKITIAHRLIILAIIYSGIINCGLCQARENLDFAKLDDQLHAIIKDKSTSDELLLQAISHLGKVTEQPAFWTEIANDPNYSIVHRRRAVFALFRRHNYADIVKSLSKKLAPAKWLQDADITSFGSEVHFGPVPMIEINENDSIFKIRVLQGSSIYIRIAGKMDRDDFSRLLRNDHIELIKHSSDGVIMECGFSDNYEQWLRTRH